ncbi:MAG: hypothetical protein HY861_04010 [Chlamydiia bacterium]|nr:hypothetical protein [Chlamydiia bacterium]
MKFPYLLSFCISLFAIDSDYTPPLQCTSHVYRTQEDGLEISYSAVAGTLPLSSSDGAPLADLFFIAYLAENAAVERPLTFVFPGGPGGSCGAEVLCTFGPKRLQTPQEGKALLPPYTIIDNPQSLLPWTDLVFIDPAGVGFSQFSDELEEKEEAQLLSVDGDIAALGNFVRTFIAYFERWNSPKYLSGISYGTVRCCGLAEYLSRYDVSLHGIILMGSAMDFSTLVGQRNQPLPDCLLLPTFAATAWYHGRLWPEAPIEEVVDYARRFALTDYASFMLQPYRFDPREQNAFYAKLAYLIGLPLETVRRYSGRFDEDLYTTEFMALDRKVIGGLDTRYIGDLSSASRCYAEDPSYRDMQGIFCAFNAYLQQELEFDLPFESYTIYSSQSWDFSTYDSFAWPDVFQRLRRALIRNPSMKVFSGSGYYDCRTPFYATEYCFDHMDLPLSYRNNLQFEYYKAGHGFVFDLPSLQKLKDDLTRFYTQSLRIGFPASG